MSYETHHGNISPRLPRTDRASRSQRKKRNENLLMEDVICNCSATYVPAGRMDVLEEAAVGRLQTSQRVCVRADM